MTIRRGQVVWVSLSPSVGSEQEKLRPAIVVSNDAANRSVTRHNRGVVTVVPLTSSRAVALPHQVSLSHVSTGLPSDSVAQIEQVRAVDISRIHDTTRQLPATDLSQITHALAVHLALR